MEDQGGPPTLDTIRRLFGDRVADTVRECSDSEAVAPGHKLPWHERKQAYLDGLRSASRDALFVSAGDKLHNARDILACYREMGDALWQRFNRNASKADHLRYYRELVRRFQGRPEAPKALVDELDRVVTELESLAEAESSTETTQAASR